MAGRDETPPPPHVAAVQELAADQPVAAGAPLAIPPRTTAERTRRVVTVVLMIALAILYLVPLAWTFITSLKTQAEAAAGFDLWPESPSLSAYREIWDRPDLSFVTFFQNSALFAISITAVNVFIATLGGYAFARLRFPLREALFLLVLATLMIPDQLRLVPVYLLMIDFPVTDWNLVGTKHGYIFFGSSIALATNLFLMRQYFLTIPKDYEEAAKLDGAGYFKTYARVMLPLAAPAVAAVAILTFQGIWNEFFWANLLLGQSPDPGQWTVQIGLAQFRFQYQTLWPQLMAAATLAILPVLVVYLFFQRYFVAGVAAAGVKG
jgi:multiple sugar transport system permease protein